MLLPLPLLLLLLFAARAATAASHRSFDWRDCNTQACYVLEECKNAARVTGKIVEVARARDVAAKQKDCPFVMMIRPLSASAWVVQLRVTAAPRLQRKQITLMRNGDLLHECTGGKDGRMLIKGRQDLTIEPHADSHSTHKHMYCLYTATSRAGTPLDTTSLSVSFVDGKSHPLASMGDVMKYVSCDGSKITMSRIKPEGDTAVAPVDATRPMLACPRGKSWKLMIELDGVLKEARSGRCVKWQGAFAYDLDMANDDLWSMATFPAVCVSTPGCASCPAPAHLACPHCARVRYRTGNGTDCARLRCPDPAGHPDKFAIGDATYMGEPVCGKNSKGGGFGWSIKDAHNKTVEFDAIACVKEVSCHDTHPLIFECEDPDNCAKPMAVDFDDEVGAGEGLLCPDDLIMKFRANDTDEWAAAYDLECNGKTGRWTALNGEIRTLLVTNATIQCMPMPDFFLFYGTIAVGAGVLLLYATFLPCYFWNRKADNEFDKKQRELSKQFLRIKEYPKSPPKSYKEGSSQHKLVGKPMVDTRIYPDELTVKRKTKKNKKKTPAKTPVAPSSKQNPELLRARVPEDAATAFCRSGKGSSKDTWEQWITETGGIVQGKKSREEVLRLRAEKRAAKEKRLEEEKKEKEEKEAKEAAEKTKPPLPQKRSRTKSGGLATDKFLMQKKVGEMEDRFITLGPPAPAASAAAPPTPAAQPAKKQRVYKKHSTPAPKEDEIKFEAPTTTHDASVNRPPQQEQPSRKVEVFVTADEPLPDYTTARDKTPTAQTRTAVRSGKTTSTKTKKSMDDRAVETESKQSEKAATEGLQSNKEGRGGESPDGADIAVESTEDEKRKRKKLADKRKKEKKKKSGGSSGKSTPETDLPEMTARAGDDEPAVDVGHSTRKQRMEEAAKSSHVMTSPSPLTPQSAGGTGTGGTPKKRRRRAKKGSQGEDKGLKRSSNKKRAGGGEAQL